MKREELDAGKSEKDKLDEKQVYIKSKVSPTKKDKEYQLWFHHYMDQNLWDEIEKDTTRTRTELSFFG